MSLQLLKASTSDALSLNGISKRAFDSDVKRMISVYNNKKEEGHDQLQCICSMQMKNICMEVK